ncbi:hypothetical protein BBF96_11535 [Anoxybacter fermentans]|uniref:Organic solvent tolerance-like N-terminal domain-containing protein n=2 Tax=Anoxybacter fermentans TaxID=1323375 RepID=A0A3Q9HR87_9FIRM|nr:hypothetical protein BBF96_11535 [Anoxybacter fermentans]
MFFIIINITLFCMITPSLAEEKVKVLGEKIKYLMSEDQLIITGDAQIITKDITIKADEILATFRDGQVIEFKALGGVTIIKDKDTYFGKELTYHLKSKTGVVLELQGESKLKDSKEKIYLYGKEAKYSPDLIEVTPGSLTSCELDEPHYFFKAGKMKIYPGDEIKLYHVTFWEFNGKIPLFYWPYYSISLKEKDQRFTYKMGYSKLTGWFLKTAYNYYNKGTGHGELYLDYYQKLGLAGGFKHFYVDEKNNKGSVYLYLQRQDERKTVPYLVFKHSHNYTYEGLRFATNTALNRYGIRDLMTNTNSVSYTKKGNTFSWNSKFTGSYQDISEYGTYILKNTVKTKLKISDINVMGELTDDRYFHEPTDNYWSGYLKVYQNKSFLNWTFLTKKKGNKNPNLNFYILPELEMKLNFNALQTDLKPFISPFTYTIQAGRYIENRSQTDAYRLVNRLDFRKDLKLIDPFILVLTGTGMVKHYSTRDVVYQYNPAVEIKTRPIYGFSTSIKYSYRNGEGESPFYFDRQTNKLSKLVSGRLSYNKYGLNITTYTGYNLITKRFSLLNNSLGYRWNEKNSIQLIVPYNIEQKKFSDLTGNVKINYSNFTFSLDTRVNPEGWEFKKFETELDWQVNKDWHINLNASFDPKKGFDPDNPKNKGKIEIIRDLHCREISMSYDAVKKEIWFNYSIKAFPNQKFRLGSNEEEPVLFDINLGGMSIGQ